MTQQLVGEPGPRPGTFTISNPLAELESGVTPLPFLFFFPCKVFILDMEQDCAPVGGPIPPGLVSQRRLRRLRPSSFPLFPTTLSFLRFFVVIERILPGSPGPGRSNLSQTPKFPPLPCRDFLSFPQFQYDPPPNGFLQKEECSLGNPSLFPRSKHVDCN